MIESISGVPQAQMLGGSELATPQSVGQLDFGSFLSSEISKVDNDLLAADKSIRALAAGENVQIHDVMIQIEKARMSLTLVAEVRNRALEAYQELMRIQL